MFSYLASLSSGTGRFYTQIPENLQICETLQASGDPEYRANMGPGYCTIAVRELFGWYNC